MQPKYVLFWGDVTPRVKRPPAEGEVYLWTKDSGDKLTYQDGEWVPLQEDPPADA
jgi:hypothetical protein